MYHVDPKVVDNIINVQNERYGKEEPFTIIRGKLYE